MSFVYYTNNFCGCCFSCAVVVQAIARMKFPLMDFPDKLREAFLGEIERLVASRLEAKSKNSMNRAFSRRIMDIDDEDRRVARKTKPGKA